MMDASSLKFLMMIVLRGFQERAGEREVGGLSGEKLRFVGEAKADNMRCCAFGRF